MSPTDLVVLLLAALALAAIGSAAALGRRQLRALVPVSAAELAEPLQVVIPARNEATNLRALLPALLAERAPGLRVLVVDDRSTDDTARVVEELARPDARLSLLRINDEPEPGVFGKPRALAAAVDEATAASAPALLLFLDADMRPAPGLLGGVVAALRRERAQAVSGVPRLLLETPVEALFLPTLVALLTAGVRPGRVHDPMAPDAFLNGQLILVETAALAQAGGWRAVTGTVLEDVALAGLLKRSGATLRLADLRPLVGTRMYSSFGEMTRGFGKNATALLGPAAGLKGGLAFLLALLPWTAFGLALARSSGPTALALAAGLFVLTLLVQARARLDVRAPVWPVLLLPLSYLGAACILARASLEHLRGHPIEWRGRHYRR